MVRFLFLFSVISLSYYDGVAQITFEKTYGQIFLGAGNSVKQTPEGDYIITGYSIDTSSNGFNYNTVLVKTNALGDILWIKNYGGALYDDGFCLQQTSDSGYIILGTTNSFLNGKDAMFLIKTDSDGDTLWTKTFNGLDYAFGYSVQQTTDNGYILVGYTKIYDYNSSKVYLVKTDFIGDTLWTKTYSYGDENIGYSIQETTDGGFIIVGMTDGPTSYSDIYVIKTDSNGDSLWTKTIGDFDDDEGRSIIELQDGNFLITGYTRNFNSPSSKDVYLVKIDQYGNTIWTKTFGGIDNDFGYSICQSNDGFVITGSWGLPYSNPNPFCNLYLIKINNDGDTIWTKTYGINYYTKVIRGYSIQQTDDNGFIIAGEIHFYDSFNYQLYLIKTDSLGNVNPAMYQSQNFNRDSIISIYPNPFTTSATIFTPVKKNNSCIKIFNLLGKEVTHLLSENYQYESQKSIIKRGNLLPGIYLLNIEEQFIKISVVD